MGKDLRDDEPVTTELLPTCDVTFPGIFGHPRSRGMREDVRHVQKETTRVHA